MFNCRSLKCKFNLHLVVLVWFFLLGATASGQISAGIGGVYGSDIQQFAPNLRAYYFPNEALCFGPEVAWFPSVTENLVERQLTELNLTGHYVFEAGARLGLYPLFGLNYSIEREKDRESTHTESAFGANLGAGFHVAFNRVIPFAEYKYVTGALSQQAVSIGILFILKNEQNHSE